ncbi:MAG TPA: PQQ-dependent sugar dehydrogenase [Jiangellales bacterium]|nr:PQQ-dependent sugar dehydrogenase [Jiangellales bacterium]
MMPLCRGVVAIAVAATIALLAACGTGDQGSLPSEPPATTEVEPSPTAEPTTEEATPSPSPTPTVEPGPVVPAGFSDLATGLSSPWGLAFLPDGSALVSERDTARVVRVTAAGAVTEVGGVPGVVPGGEGGLLGLEVGPDPEDPGYVYAYFTAASDNRLVRMPWDGSAVGPPEVLLEGVPKARNHDGGRIAFGPDGRLYIATGDAGEPSRSQALDSPAGKILRLEPDGGIPADNPFPGSPVWSLGHRNVQGLAFDDEGRLWAGEFGQKTYDELNLIEPGANYGWPEVEGPGDGGGRFVEPVAVWNPTGDASPSGIAWVRDTVFLAALAGERLLRVPVPGGTAGEPDEAAVGQFGRLRTVEPAPDGSLWMITSNTDGRGDPQQGDDRILRVTLAPE